MVHFTPETKEHRTWLNFLIVIAIPLTAFIFSRTGFPLRRIGNIDSIHALLILTIIITLVFLFFLIRTIFIVAGKKANFNSFWFYGIAVLNGILICLPAQNAWKSRVDKEEAGTSPVIQQIIGHQRGRSKNERTGFIAFGYFVRAYIGV